MVLKARKVARAQDPQAEMQLQELVRVVNSLALKVEQPQVNVGSNEPVYTPPEVPGGLPRVPQNLFVAPALRSMIVIWNASLADGRTGAYELQFAISTTYSTDVVDLNSDNFWGSWQQINVGRVLVYTHNDLNSNYGYKYRVRSSNGTGLSSAWSEEVVGGFPRKASLSEDVVGKLAGKYIAEGVISEEHLGEPISNSLAEIGENSAFISNFTQTPEEISSTVAEVFPNGTMNHSTIQQTSDMIALRIDGDQVKSPTGITIGTVDGDGYILLDADKVIMPGTLTVNFIEAGTISSDKLVVGGIEFDRFAMAWAENVTDSITLQDLGSYQRTIQQAMGEDQFVVINGTISGTNVLFTRLSHNDLNSLLGLVVLEIQKWDGSWQSMGMPMGSGYYVDGLDVMSATVDIQDDPHRVASARVVSLHPGRTDLIFQFYTNLGNLVKYSGTFNFRFKRHSVK